MTQPPTGNMCRRRNHDVPVLQLCQRNNVVQLFAVSERVEPFAADGMFLKIKFLNFQGLTLFAGIQQSVNSEFRQPRLPVQQFIILIGQFRFIQHGGDIRLFIIRPPVHPGFVRPDNAEL